MDRNSIADATGRKVTRTPETVAQYRRKGHELLALARRETKNAALDLEGALAWYGRQAKRYKGSSLRFQRRAWGTLIEDAVAAGTLLPNEGERLHLMLASSEPERKGSRAVKRTSARKVKDARGAELKAVYKYLVTEKKADPRDGIAGKLLIINGFLGLRPIEWQGALRIGDTLFVCCAKTTNGRGLSDVRPISLVDWSPDERQGLDEVLAYVKPWALKPASEFQKEMDRLRQRIAHACRVVGVRRLSPYGMRHTCTATLRRLGVAPEQIAAQLGHGTTRTQTTHYARAGAGLSLKAAKTAPGDPKLVTKVRTHEGFSLERIRPSASGPKL